MSMASLKDSPGSVRMSFVSIRIAALFKSRVLER